MLNLDNFLALKDDIKFELYKSAQDEIQYLRSLVSTMAKNINNATVYSNQAESQNQFENFDHPANSKFSDKEDMTTIQHQYNNKINKQHQFEPIQTRGLASRQPMMTQPTTQSDPNRGRHIALPREGPIDALIIGDSITNRLHGDQIGPKVIARGFGGHTTKSLLERTSNTKPRDIKQVCILIGANDCMSENFDIKDTTGVYEKLIYTVAHKFSPEIITLCTVTPLGAFRKDQNANVINLNKKIKSFLTGLKDLQTTKLTSLDFYTTFTQNPAFLSTDGVHPTERGVKGLVELLRSALDENNVQTSECDITMRPKFKRDITGNNNQQMLHYFRKGFDFFSKNNFGHNVGQVSMQTFS